MVINHNIPAVSTLGYLKKNTAKAQRSLEKLSSGLKINKAADDASGLAISEKMKAQINGLSKARNNVTNGVSVVQTADSALNEVQSTVQRLNELAVQAQNGTLTDDDKDKLQAETDALLEQLDSTASSTNFNSNSLFIEKQLNSLFCSEGLQIQDGDDSAAIMNVNLNNIVPAEWVGSRTTSTADDMLVKTTGAAVHVSDNFGTSSGTNNFDLTHLTISSDPTSTETPVPDASNGTPYIVISHEKYTLSDLYFQNGTNGAKQYINNDTLLNMGGIIPSGFNRFSFKLTNEETGAAHDVTYSGTSDQFEITTKDITTSSALTKDPATYYLNLSAVGSTTMTVHVTDSSITEISANSSDMTQASNGEYVRDSTTGNYVLYSLLNIPDYSAPDTSTLTRYSLASGAMTTSATRTFNTADAPTYDISLSDVSHLTAHTTSPNITKLTPDGYYTTMVSDDTNGTYVKISNSDYVPYSKVENYLTHAEQNSIPKYDLKYLHADIGLTNGNSVSFSAGYEQNVTIGIHSFTAYVGAGLGETPNNNMDTDNMSTGFYLKDAFGNIVGSPHYTYMGDNREYNYEYKNQYPISGITDPDNADPESGEVRYSGTSYPEKLINAQMGAVSKTRAEMGVSNFAGIGSDGRMIFHPPVYLAVNKMATLTAKDGASNLYVSGTDTTALGLGYYDGISTVKLDITNNEAIDMISHALDSALSFRSKLGAYQNQMSYINDNLSSESENLTSAQSALTDTDIAKEMSEYTKNSTLMQISQSMITQENQLTEGILSILK